MPMAIPARGTGTRGTGALQSEENDEENERKNGCRPVDLSEFCDSLREAWEEIRRFHLEAEDLAELTGDNREAPAVEEAVENRL